MDFVAQMARLRVACETGTLPRDLGRWLLGELAERSEYLERIDLRNALLRAAAAHVDGPTKTKARHLRIELLALERTRPASEIRQLLAEAAAIDPRCPTSVKQLARIIGDTEGAIDVPGFGGVI